MMTALVTDSDKEIQSDSKSETEFLLKEDNEDNAVDNLEYPLSNSSAYMSIEGAKAIFFLQKI